MKIIITGASGFIATELIMKLLTETDYQLYLVSTNVEKLFERYNFWHNKVHCYALDDFINSALRDNYYNVCIHTAFARSSVGSDLVSALDYTSKLLLALKNSELHTFVNISSQSVYDNSVKPLWDESVSLNPDYMYALGKYSSEILTSSILSSTSIKWTNIRLSSVCENARFLNIFVKNALLKIPIKLTASMQTCSFIDVRDVADALFLLIQKTDSTILNKVYNLGTNSFFTIKEIAYLVKEIGDSRYGTDVSIEEMQQREIINAGVNSELFKTSFGWEPKYDMRKMIISLFERFKNVEERVSGRF